MKRILTVQDISCVGKCSLTVALPIISAAGVETAVLPTAVLSNHTAFKEGFTFRDLTEDIPAIHAQWQKENIHFDAIYTGYLGSTEQIHLVQQLFEDYGGKDKLILVDPAMGDFGKLYTGFTGAFAEAMTSLCAKADIIVPNITEATIMLGEEYIESGYTRSYIEQLLRRLTDLGPKEAALTGISFDENRVGTMSYNRETDTFFEYYNTRQPVSFHGTGDIFASALLGAKMKGKTTEEALTIAVDYTSACIEYTMKDPNANWYGVNFEEALPLYLKLLNCTNQNKR